MYDQPIRVLLVDDDPRDVDLVRCALAAYANPRFVMESVATLAKATQRVRHQMYDLVLLKLEEQGPAQTDILARFRKACDDDLPIIALTNLVDQQSVVDAVELGTQEYIDRHNAPPDDQWKSERYELFRQHLSRQRQVTTETLEEKNKRLRQLCDTAQQFVENVCHEFRTPLAVIREFTSIIRDGLDGPVSEKQVEHLNKVLHRIDDLALMVDDMLDISKLGAGLLGVWRRKCHVEELIENVIDMLQGRAAAKGVSLSARTPENLPSVFCDEEKARRVITNLTVNAIKFAPEGGRVDVWTRYATGQGDIEIGVSDNGPGIGNDEMQTIFERFRQGEQHFSTAKGFGLGLSITKELVRLNLGKIDVETETGVGSTFSFTLPLYDPRVVFERFLDWLASTDKATAEMLMLTVNIDPRKHKAAPLVDEFLHRVVRANELVMPGGKGSWVLAAARSEADCDPMIHHLGTEWDDYTRNCPQVTLPDLEFRYRGSWSITEQRQDMIEAFTELHDLHRVDRRSTPTVLVVDDDYEVIQCLSVRLRSAGFQVLAASDGDEGVRAACSEHPDAIVLDVRMPKKDGLTALRELREHPTTKDTPIIMLSAAIQDQQKAMQSGASFFVRKPYNADGVLSAIESSFQEIAT